MAPALQVRQVTKTFVRRPERGLRGLFHRAKDLTTALDRVDLEVARGELFGLLGPNGAGKTTLVKILATLLLPTSGEARVAGYDVVADADEVRRRLGVVLGGERALYWRLTGRENLWYFSQLYNMPDARARPRIQELLDLVGLAERADERVENYSKGMKQRLHIARGLLHDPEILLLDEPTIGLDPHAARELRRLVRQLVDEHGRTVVLTTHYLYEADALSDRVAVLHKGRLVASDTPSALKARFADRAAFRVSVRADTGARVAAALAQARGVAGLAGEEADAARGTVTFRVLARDGVLDELPGTLARAVEEAKGQLVALTRDEPSLEDVFVALTGERLGEAPRPAAEA